MDDALESIAGMPVAAFIERPINENLIQMLEMAHSAVNNQFVIETIEKFNKKEINRQDIINMIYSIRTPDGNKKRIIDQYKICRSRNSSEI